MLHKLLTSLLGVQIANVRFEKEDKNTVIYLSDTNELFNTLRYGGFVRSVSSERVERDRGFVFLTTYKLVLFLDKDMCDSDALNFILNSETKRTGYSELGYVKVKRYFLDSLDNVKKEIKDKIYLKYKVVIADLEVEEIICKTKITCNE